MVPSNFSTSAVAASTSRTGATDSPVELIAIVYAWQKQSELAKVRLSDMKEIEEMFRQIKLQEKLLRLKSSWEKARLEEGLEKEKMEKERLEKERQKKEKLEKERLEKEKWEKERLRKERLEWEKQEREKLEKERLDEENGRRRRETEKSG
ncbi:hypothetical protein Esti_000225 [Eimeria stiedai]